MPAAPKRRNAGRTKARILTAAQKAFAERGYAQVGIRDIAAMAGVSPSLVVRYFGSKTGLFEAALLDALEAEELFEDKAGFGARMALALASRDVDVKLAAMIVLSAGDEEASGVTARLTNERIIAPLAEWLGPPDAQARAATIVMLSTGIVLFTRQIPLMIPPPKMVEWVADALQALVDQS